MTTVTIRDQQKKQKKPLEVGTFYGREGELYLCCRAGADKIALVNVRYGSWWSEPVVVISWVNVTEAESDKVMAGATFVPYHVKIDAEEQ